jgi:hypothetical protein
MRCRNAKASTDVVDRVCLNSVHTGPIMLYYQAEHVTQDIKEHIHVTFVLLQAH